jgi:hypothetical protein
LTNERKPVLDYSRILKFDPERISLGESIDAGTLIRFTYGQKSVDRPGGWKNDPRPIIIVLYDDQKKYIEGINVNYLNTAEIGQLFSLLSRYSKPLQSDAAGQDLYKYLNGQAPEIVKKSYRKFKREAIAMAFEYKADIIGSAVL